MNSSATPPPAISSAANSGISDTNNNTNRRGANNTNGSVTNNTTGNDANTYENDTNNTNGNDVNNTNGSGAHSSNGGDTNNNTNGRDANNTNGSDENGTNSLSHNDTIDDLRGNAERTSLGVTPQSNNRVGAPTASAGEVVDHARNSGSSNNNSGGLRFLGNIGNFSDSDSSGRGNGGPSSASAPGSGESDDYARSSSSDDSHSGGSGLVGRIANSSSSSDSGFSSDQSGCYLESPPTKSYVHVRTQQKADTNCVHGPRVLCSLCRYTDPLKSPAELVEELRKDLDPIQRSELRKQVDRTLPRLVSEKRWVDIAAFLTVDSVRAAAITHLQTSMLLQLRNSQDVGVRDQLLQVGAVSREVLMELGDTCSDLLPLLVLHLSILSALISRCPPTHLDKLSPLAGIKKSTKKKSSSEGLKDVVLRTLYTFHEGLEDALDQAGSFRTGGHQPPHGESRKGLFVGDSCQGVITVFSLLNQVNQHGWEEQEGEELLKSLHDTICVEGSGASSSKHKLSEDCKGAFDFLLTRLLALLLTTTFEEEKPQVGPLNSRHHEWITNILVKIAEKANSTVRSCLLKEVTCLTFHKAKYVRQTFNCFWRTEEPLSVLAQGYLEKHLQIVGFSQRSPVSSKKGNKVHDNCSWKPFTCEIDHRPAEGFMYIPKASCLGNEELDTCLRQHPERDAKSAEEREQLREESQRHIKNLDMLKSLSPWCKNLVELKVYQTLPFPVYITEQVSHHRLLDHLLAHREAEQWLTNAQLVRITQQLAEAFVFLSSRNIDPRGVTGYNVMVQPGERCRRRSSGTLCSVLTTDDFTIKLTDMGLAHCYKIDDPVYNSADIRLVDYQGAIPVRWLSPEAMFKGHYGEKNMVYNLGCLMYELWTHGVQPYSSYDEITEDLLMKMLTQPGSIELAHRPCIPDAVYRLIKRCTHHNPEERPALQEVVSMLPQLKGSESQDVREPGLERSLTLKKKYTNISPSQKTRNHVPETGIPKSVQDVLLAGSKSDQHIRARNRSTVRRCSHNVVTDEDLTPHDWIRFSHQEGWTLAEEVVSTTFVQDVWQSIRTSDQRGVTCYSQSEDSKPRLNPQDDGTNVHTREYPPSITLESAAQCNLLWDRSAADGVYEDDEDDPNSYLHVLSFFISLAHVLEDLHEKNWIVRDLREENILVEKETGQAILPRIGRMHQLSPNDTYFLDDVPQDSRRRVSAEVARDGKYTKENDVYMLGLVMRQVYMIKEVVTDNPHATRQNFAPFHDIPLDMLTKYIRDPNREEDKPKGCPDWLHELSVQCRDPDPDKRPTAKEVTAILRQRQVTGAPSTPFIRDCPRPDPDNNTGPSEQHEGLAAMQLRNRNSQRRARPWTTFSNILTSLIRRPARETISTGASSTLSSDIYREAVSQTAVDQCSGPVTSTSRMLSRSDQPRNFFPSEMAEYDEQEQTAVKSIATVFTNSSLQAPDFVNVFSATSSSQTNFDTSHTTKSKLYVQESAQQASSDSCRGSVSSVQGPKLPSAQAAEDRQGDHRLGRLLKNGRFPSLSPIYVPSPLEPESDDMYDIPDDGPSDSWLTGLSEGRSETDISEMEEDTISSSERYYPQEVTYSRLDRITAHHVRPAPERATSARKSSPDTVHSPWKSSRHKGHSSLTHKDAQSDSPPRHQAQRCTADSAKAPQENVLTVQVLARTGVASGPNSYVAAHPPGQAGGQAEMAAEAPTPVISLQDPRRVLFARRPSLANSDSSRQVQNELSEAEGSKPGGRTAWCSNEQSELQTVTSTRDIRDIEETSDDHALLLQTQNTHLVPESVASRDQESSLSRNDGCHDVLCGSSEIECDLRVVPSDQAQDPSSGAFMGTNRHQASTCHSSEGAHRYSQSPCVERSAIARQGRVFQRKAFRDPWSTLPRIPYQLGDERSGEAQSVLRPAVITHSAHQSMPVVPMTQHASYTSTACHTMTTHLNATLVPMPAICQQSMSGGSVTHSPRNATEVMATMSNKRSVSSEEAEEKPGDIYQNTPEVDNRHGDICQSTTSERDAEHGDVYWNSSKAVVIRGDVYQNSPEADAVRGDNYQSSEADAERVDVHQNSPEADTVRDDIYQSPETDTVRGDNYQSSEADAGRVDVYQNTSETGARRGSNDWNSRMLIVDSLNPYNNQYVPIDPGGDYETLALNVSTELERDGRHVYLDLISSERSGNTTLYFEH